MVSNARCAWRYCSDHDPYKGKTVFPSRNRPKSFSDHAGRRRYRDEAYDEQDVPKVALSDLATPGPRFDIRIELKVE